MFRGVAGSVSSKTVKANALPSGHVTVRFVVLTLAISLSDPMASSAFDVSLCKCLGTIQVRAGPMAGDPGVRFRGCEHLDHPHRAAGDGI